MKRSRGALFGSLLRFSALGAFLALVAPGPRLGLAEERTAADDPVRLKEMYVPYDVFDTLTKASRDGVIMELAEYRELVRAAARNARGLGAADLPPRDAVVSSARYLGEASGASVLFAGELEILVARDGWVSCPLGLPPAALGSVLVDDGPGWLIQAPPAAVDERTGQALGEHTLLLQGRGRHIARVTFSLPIIEEGERSVLAGSVFAASASTIEVAVAGEAEGVAQPGVLSTARENDRTIFRIANGSSGRFALGWSRKRQLDESAALLMAYHSLFTSVRPRQVLFAWTATVDVARRKIAELILEEPAGATIVSIAGDLLHSWEPVEGGVRVVLKEPALGRVVLRIDGVLPAPEDRFTVSAPRVRGAYANLGTIELSAPSARKLAIEGSEGLREVEASRGEHGGSKRSFAFATSGARITARVLDEKLECDWRAAFVARAWEESLTLHGYASVVAKSGETYQLALAVPSAWRIARLAETTAAGAARGVRFDELTAAVDSYALLYLDRALDRSHPLELEIVLEAATYPPADGGWNVALALPHLVGATRSRTDLAISLQSAFYLGATELAGWRALLPEEIARLGLEGKGREEEQAAARIVAGLTTDAAAPELAVRLVQRAARGEYRGVVHVLATERAAGTGRDEQTLRVRADFRLTVVDRGIDALTFRLPKLAATTNVVILGDGIKERSQDAAAGTHLVRFARPWLETRQFRIEYEVPCTPGSNNEIPAISVDGDFGGERFLVIQSQGSVEVESAPGAGLAAIDIDDIPDFAEPWIGGRVLGAYRLRATGTPGTLKTVVHDRAPVLARLAREMTLETVIGQDGTAHTRAEFLLSYAREQALRIRLPAGARTVGVTVDGEPIRALRVEPARAGDLLPVHAIPLPPRSYCTISILYTDAAAEEAVEERMLGRWGSLQMAGPELLDIPVGETTWRIYHPAGYRWFAAGGNVRATGLAAAADLPFLLRLFQEGEFPLGALAPEAMRGARAPLAPLSPEELGGAEGVGAGGGEGQSVQRLAPVEMRQSAEANRGQMAQQIAQQLAVQADGQSDLRPRAPLHRLLPEGLVLELRKLGGSPRVTLDYLEIAWWNFAKRAVFFGTLGLALVLGLRRRTRALAALALGSLALGTLLPLALGKPSPLFWDPLCEASIWVLVGWLLALLWRGALRRFGAGAASAPLVLAAAAVGAFALALGAGPGAPRAWAEPAPPSTGETPAPVASDEQVLIPYSAKGAPWDPGTVEGGKAFVPEARFRELWRLAHPAESDPARPIVPERFLLGSAAYEVAIEGERFRLTGSVPLIVFGDGWIELSLIFDAQPVRIRVDGEETGVVRRAGAPCILVQGAGEHRIDFECVGPVQPHLGFHWVTTRLVANAASTVTATLPAGAELAAKQSAPGAVVTRTDDGATRLRFELSGRVLHFAWTFPEREGELAAQIESLSYTELALTPDGIDVRRRERVRAAGRAIDRVAYRIDGDWQILEVAGGELAEWRVTPAGAAGEPARLHLVFARALAESEFAIYGHVAMAERGALPALTLEGAVRKEAFVGLRPGSGRRFLPESLATLRRATAEELARALPGPGPNARLAPMPTPAELPDRILHVHGSGAGESLALGPVQEVVRLATDGVLLWRADRMQYFLRVRYSQPEKGPLRHEMMLPQSWSVRRVQSSKLESWEVVEEAGAKRLIIRFAGGVRAGTEILIGAEGPLPAAEAAAPLAALRARPESLDARLEETWSWIAGADEDLNLVPGAASNWEPAAVEATEWFASPPGTSLRFAYRTRRPDAVLEFNAMPLAGTVSASIVAFARLGEEALEANARIVYRFRSATRERFDLRLPPGAELVRGETRNQRRQGARPTPLGLEIEFELQSAARDEQAIDLSYRVARVGEKLPELLPIVLLDGGRRLEAVDQYAGVLQATRALTLDAVPAGLVPIELGEVPYVPRNVSARSLRSTYRAVALDWKLSLREQTIELAGKLDAHIKLADLTTRIGGDGTVRTQVAYSLINQGLQFLPVELPAGADLWGVTVNGLPVAVGGGAAAAGGSIRRVLIPVEHAGRSELPLEVILVYEERGIDLPALLASHELAAPRLVDGSAVPIEQTIWSVHFPDDYFVRETSKRMRQAPVSLKPAEKVRGLLKQQEAVRDVAKGADSMRARQRAAQELARIEAALSDNLAELQASNRSQAELSQQKLVGEAETQQQWEQNTRIIDEAGKAQVELRAEIRQEAERKVDAEASRDEEAFRDRCNFLRGQGWEQQEEQVPARGDGKDGARAPAAKGRTKADELLDGYSFRGFEGVPFDAGTQKAEVARPVPIEAAGAPAPAFDAALGGSAPRLALGEPREGYATYTFRRMDGDANLTLRLSAHDSVTRVAAWTALIFAAISILLWRQRRRRSRA